MATEPTHLATDARTRRSVSDLWQPQSGSRHRSRESRQSRREVFGVEANSLTGHYVGAGDFNGDGYSDVVIGAHQALGTGRAYIVWGGTSLPQTIDLANPGTAAVTIVGTATDDLAGNPVSSLGDINNDGFDDFGAGIHLGGRS
ncbi:MAG: FG-GAP repeat protein [Planctomycetaceae bacterium]